MGGSSGWTFDRCVATDGVACSVRYYREAAKDKKERTKKKIKKNDGSAAEQSTKPSQPQQHLRLEGKRLIGIDPGRKNIAFCVELDAGDTRKIVKKTKLTSKQYYCDSGITKQKKRIEDWLSDQDYKSASEQLSKYDLGSLEYLETLYSRQHHDTVWKTKTSKK